MKVLMINGSPRKGGNTSVALEEMKKIFATEGIECDEMQIGNKDIRGCIACNGCSQTGECVFGDEVVEAAKKLDEADGIVVATPVYYASANGTLISFLNRLFYSYHGDTTMKVGAAISVARRDGLATTMDELNKYFGICGMPIATSRYWNGAYGREKGEVSQDKEGMQVMRILARNMAFLMKSIALGKDQFGLPEKEETEFMHFIR